jgi:hypothetical protein
MRPERVQEQVAKRCVVVAFVIVRARSPLVAFRAILVARPMEVVDLGAQDLSTGPAERITELIGEGRLACRGWPVDSNPSRMREPD